VARIPVGAVTALGRTDRVVATYWGHGWAWSSVRIRSQFLPRYVGAKCEGPMRGVALIDDPGVVRRIFEHLGYCTPEPAER
jgi:hypothetical protein